MGNQERAIISELEGRVTANSNRILSLSGGGVKGIAELVVLSEIEERTGKSITELFPIITGTSVGGLIAGLLTIPKEPGSSEAKYSAKEALEIFKEAAPKIFEQHWYSGVKQVFKHKYSQRALKQVLEEHVGNHRLSNATSRLMIPVTNLNTEGREVELFDSHDLFGKSGHSDPKMQDLLLATTAAPTYFKSVSNAKYVKGYSNKEEVVYAYADGGLGANRPAYEAFKKIRKEQNSKEEGAIIVSLNLNNEIAATRAIPRGRNDGIVGWLTKGKLVERLLKSSEDAAVESIHNILGDKDKHYEMVLPIGKDTASLDDASQKNIAALKKIGRKYISKHDEELNNLCQELVNNLAATAGHVQARSRSVSSNLAPDEGYESSSEIEHQGQNKNHGEKALEAKKGILVVQERILDQDSKSKEIKVQEIFEGMKFVRKKSGGANESGKYGGIYKNKIDGTLSMIKQESNISKNISEYMGSRIFAAVSKGNGAEVLLRVPAEAKEQIALSGTSKTLDKEIYVESKFLKNYADDMYVDMDKHMSAKTKPSSWLRKDGARPLFVGSRNKLHSTLDNAFKELRYKGFEDIMPASLLIGDFDVHVGNIGVIRDRSKPDAAPELARIDFAGSLSKLTKNIYPHSRMKHLPGFGPTNHFREFPSEMRRNNKEFGRSLVESAKKDLSSSIEDSFKELSKYYSVTAIQEWATRSGAISAKDKDSFELAGIKQRFKELMCTRQESLKTFGMEVLLSSVIKKGVGGKHDIDKQQLKDLVQEYPKEFKEVLSEYEKTGNLKVSKKEYRTKEIQEKLIKGLKGMITDIDQEQTKKKESSAAELLKEFKKKYNIQESNKENITESYKSDNVLQEQVTEETTAQDSVSFGTSGVGISLNSEGVDPITESIRKEILQKQREQLRLFFSTMHPELEEHTLDDERFKKFLNKLNSEQRELVNSALENEKVKAAMEAIEIVGYRNIHTRFSSSNYPSGFKPMDWSHEGELNIRLQIVQNEAGTKIATLKEQTHKTSPLTISKQDGSVVLVNAYRTIDFPVKLEEPASGTMHLSLVAKDKDGQAPSVTKAVYFTAHYEATPKPNGVPKLKEVSSPQPIKFLGSSIDAVGYIEHGGEIYTLPVTKGKYEEMIKEVARNKGQAIDLSLAVGSKAQDLISSIEQVPGAEIKRVTGEGLVKSGLAEKLDEETINNSTDLNVEQIKHHKAQLTKYKKILEEHIEPALKCRDKEREQILLLTKKCLTDSKHKQFEPYIKQTAEQHIELHHEAYLKEADGGKSLTELTEIMNNIGYKSFTSENSQDNSRGASGKIKDVLKAGGKLGFNIVLESLKAGGVENYIKQKAIEESKKVGSYVANSIADRIKATLSGKAQNSASISSSAAIKQNMIGMNGNTSKSLGVGR